MKRYGNLWPQIIAFENLLKASRQAQKGKRFRDNVLAFNYHLEQSLHSLQTELTTQTYHPGPYRTFQVMEPKQRMISAAPYRDRVVHHALCNIIRMTLQFIAQMSSAMLEPRKVASLGRLNGFLGKQVGG